MWNRIHAALRRRIKYRITSGGVLFSLALVLVGAAAAISANNLLFLILAAMLATLMVSGLISRLCLAGLELELLLPEHIFTGQATAAIMKLRNLKNWMPSFSIHVEAAPAPSGDAPILEGPLYFPVLPGGKTLEEKVAVRFARRGAHQENLFVVSTKFPFGFLEKTATVTLRRETLVYPSITALAGFEDLLASAGHEMESRFRGQGSDFYHIRPYEAFESARHVDWRSTAHTGELQLREFAREQQRRIEIFLDRNANPDGAAWFEMAVSCCAFLVWNLPGSETEIHFRSQQFEALIPEEGDVYTILKYLALVQPQSGRAAEYPADESNFQILFSVEPNRFLEMGWTPARVFSADAFAAGGDGAEPATDRSADAPATTQH